MTNSIPLLADHEAAEEEDEIGVRSSLDDVSRKITRQLYLSHILSTWNSRVFEFGAGLYLARIFPDTFVPMSIYAVCRGLSAALLSPSVGHHIDVRDRLEVVRTSIGKSRQRRGESRLTRR